MKERPILFSTEMVRAILAGRKTQTRRVVKFNDHLAGDRDHAIWVSAGQAADGTWVFGDRPNMGPFFKDLYKSGGYECPYGVPGDRLWVRETWFPDPPIDGWDGDEMWAGCGRSISGVPMQYRNPEYCIYAASWDGMDLCWKPSIHMPRWASRITLEVVSVRVERVQDIGRQDAVAEGCPMPTQRKGMHPWPEDQYRELWDQLNAKRGFGWDVNPWVWVVEFRRVKHA